MPSSKYSTFFNGGHRGGLNREHGAGFRTCGTEGAGMELLRVYMPLVICAVRRLTSSSSAGIKKSKGSLSSSAIGLITATNDHSASLLTCHLPYLVMQFLPLSPFYSGVDT